MSVFVKYYRQHQSGVVEAFTIDIAKEMEHASAAGDNQGARRLRELWLDHFDVELPAKGSAKLVAYLEGRLVWREDGEWIVFKTVDEPCIAYTAQVNDGGSVTLIALGACYRYPSGSDEIWWRQVIQPRVRRL